MFAEAARNAPTERIPPVRNDGHKSDITDWKDDPKNQTGISSLADSVEDSVENLEFEGILLKKPCTMLSTTK